MQLSILVPSVEVTQILLTSVNDVLVPKTSLQEYADFDENQVQHWVDSISEKCIQGLADLQKPFKYIGESHEVNSRLSFSEFRLVVSPLIPYNHK